MHKGLKISFQIIFYILFSWLMNKIVEWFHIPIPGSILGMVIVFLLLQTKWLSLKHVEAGANWLIATLLLFFIPPAVGIISYRQLLMSKGIQFAVVIGVGTLIVMISSGFLAQQIARRKEREVQ